MTKVWLEFELFNKASARGEVKERQQIGISGDTSLSIINLTKIATLAIIVIKGEE
jgi:hypothetical protein